MRFNLEASIEAKLKLISISTGWLEILTNKNIHHTVPFFLFFLIWIEHVIGFQYLDKTTSQVRSQ